MPVPVGSARDGGRTSHPGAHTPGATPRHRPRHRRPPGVHHRRRASRTARTGASDSQGPGAGAQPQTARLQRPRRRVKARRRQHAGRHALRRRQHLTRHAALLAKEHAIVVVEDLDHKAMRSKGGQHKRGINRTLAEAAPGEFIAALRRKLTDAGRWLIAVPAPYTSRQCVAYGSRETVLRRATIQCPSCGTSHDRDHAAGANILLRGMAAQAVLQRNSGPSGSAETARKRRLPAWECWRAHRAALVRDPAGTGSERLRDHAVRGLAQERWGRSPPERRCDSSCAPQALAAARIRMESRQLMGAMTRH